MCLVLEVKVQVRQIQLILGGPLDQLVLHLMWGGLGVELQYTDTQTWLLHSILEALSCALLQGKPSALKNEVMLCQR